MAQVGTRGATALDNRRKSDRMSVHPDTEVVLYLHNKDPAMANAGRFLGRLLRTNLRATDAILVATASGGQVCTIDLPATDSSGAAVVADKLADIATEASWTVTSYRTRRKAVRLH
ncbi:MAG: hypothetical protein HYV63_33975 [Candidatus Schekmanbacteria bacterium]|nr:hypothetical protein [Candidatus Schekmanbacteria bacterium]